MGDHGNEESPSWLPGSAPRSATLGSVQGAASAGAESSLAPPGSTFHLRAAERRRERSKKGTAGLCGTVAMEMHRRAPTTTLRTLFPGSQALPGSRVFPGSARLCVPHYLPQSGEEGVTMGDHGNEETLRTLFPGSQAQPRAAIPGSQALPGNLIFLALPGSAFHTTCRRAAKRALPWSSMVTRNP
jgi:hypothetical protein